VVIDPSISTAPESVNDWQRRLGDPVDQILVHTWWGRYSHPEGGNRLYQQTKEDMLIYQEWLLDRCNDIGPPPYSF
jgi:hypothetical protein